MKEFVEDMEKDKKFNDWLMEGSMRQDDLKAFVYDALFDTDL